MIKVLVVGIQNDYWLLIEHNFDAANIFLSLDSKW